ncbi:MAG TPA: class I SAM-dependent methyltransferase, partial [Paraburkholderia sp.]|nr:class I SAM-dependent methyltransferase [Paraburkholderia sp.]
KEKIFHGDPVKPNDGVLVWTLPALQMLVELAKIGFCPQVFNVHFPEFGIIGPWSLVFVATKPAT